MASRVVHWSAGLLDHFVIHLWNWKFDPSEPTLCPETNERQEGTGRAIPGNDRYNAEGAGQCARNDDGRSESDVGDEIDRGGDRRTLMRRCKRQYKAK